MGECLYIEMLTLGNNPHLTGTLPVADWLQPIRCYECQLEGKATIPESGWSSSCGNAECLKGYRKPFTRLMSLGLQQLIRMSDLHEGSNKIQSARPNVRIYIEPYLPQHSIKRSDALDADIEKQKIEEELTLKEDRRQSNAGDDAIMDRLKRNTHLNNTSDEEGGQGKIDIKAIREKQKEDDRLKLIEEELLEASLDSDITAAWRLGSKEGKQEDTLQLAIAYELGLFGLNKNVNKAIKLLKLIASDPVSIISNNDNSEYVKAVKNHSKFADTGEFDDLEDLKLDDSVNGESENEVRSIAISDDSLPKKSELALKELQRLEAQERNKFIAGGGGEDEAGVDSDPYALPDTNWGLEEAPHAAHKAVKVDPNPYMSTFATSVYSVALDHVYERAM